MQKLLFIVTLFTLMLAACVPALTSTPIAQETSVTVDNSMPVPGVDATEVVVVPEGKLPAPAFESKTYLNESVGFALDYPAQWTVVDTIVGERGSQSLLLSAPELANSETLPSGATRVSIIVNQWEPKNDLTAFVEMRKTAWDSSAIKIVEEERLILDLGLDAVRFTVQTAEGATILFQFAAIGDSYVTISGEGNLDLVREIMDYLRPINP